MPLIVAQLTDPHLRADEPERALLLERAVDAVLAAELPLAAVIVSGDVADRGLTQDYASVPAQLARFGEVPVVVVPGNHDARGPMRASLELPGDADAPIQSVVDLAGLRIVAADTVVPGETGGALDVDWVRAALAADVVTPTLLVLHHAPMAIGSVEMDGIALRAADSAELGGLLAEVPNVLAVLCGHTHRGVLGQLGGVPVITAPSCVRQLSFDPPGAPEIDWTEDPPAVVFHVLVDGRLVTHLQPIG